MVPFGLLSKTMLDFSNEIPRNTNDYITFIGNKPKKIDR